jgi:hypothetical protein
MRKSTLLLTFTLVLTLSAVTWACPMCKDSLSNGDALGNGGLPSGFNTSIEIMLVGFLAAVTMVAAVIWKGIRG